MWTMANKPIKDRMVENEAVFRQYNERLQHSMEELKRMAKEMGMNHLVGHDVDGLYFYCECSDENCTERVRMDPAKYDKIHHDRKKFIMLPGHEVMSIEVIISKEDGYNVVKKNKDIPPPPHHLHDTPIDNT